MTAAKVGLTLTDAQFACGQIKAQPQFVHNRARIRSSMAGVLRRSLLTLSSVASTEQGECCWHARFGNARRKAWRSYRSVRLRIIGFKPVTVDADFEIQPPADKSCFLCQKREWHRFSAQSATASVSSSIVGLLSVGRGAS